MPEGAHITSVEALEAFRTHLILYLSKARPTLDEVSSEVLRTRLWLQNDRRQHWEGQVRRRAKILETARQELFSAGIANLRETSAAEILAVRKAEHALEEAENKLRLVKKWDRELDSRLAPLAKQLEKLQTVLANDLPMGTAYLTQAIQTLDAYADTHLATELASPAPPNASGPAPAPLAQSPNPTL